MKSNRLKLNFNKTQFLWLGSRQQLAKIDTKTMTISEHSIESSTSAKNLGVTFDSELGMDLHVNNITHSCFYQVRQLRSIRRSFPADAAKTLVPSLISSRVDYCNSVVVRRLQSVLNAALLCAEGSAPLASHPSAYRLQDCGLCLQRPPRSRSDIPQLHLKSGPGGWRQGSPAFCLSRRPDRNTNQDPSFRAQKLPCLRTGCLELTARGHSNSGTVTGTFQIYVENTFISSSICLAALTALL